MSLFIQVVVLVMMSFALVSPAVGHYSYYYGQTNDDCSGGSGTIFLTKIVLFSHLEHFVFF